jgi:photosystem II stability/assembly factor-like uncharacterized protein
VSADVTGDVMSDRRGNPGLNSVAFTDAHHGWAVGYGGAILATSDGGATWTAQTSGTNATLKCVTFADSRHGWAVGSGAGGASNNAPVILATSDGGAIWKAQDASSAGSSAVLYSVAFTDADHGWAVGATYESNFTASYGVILATSDGGTTWAAEESGTKDPLNSVSFVDDTHGWAVGDRGTILVYNTAPAPVGAVSSKGAGAWPVEAVIIVLVIIGALVLSLRARRRRAIRVALTADLPASDSRRPAGGAGQLSPASESSEKAVHCTACGAPARATSAFCGSCGAKVVPRNE